MPNPVVWIALGSLTLGLSLGSCIGGSTDVKVVHVPTYKTRVVEKQVHTSTPLPESCRAAVADLFAVAGPAGTESSAAGQILLVISDLGRARAMTDVKAINKSTTQLRRLTDRLNNAVVASSEARSKLQTNLDQCYRDTQNR